MGSSDRDPSADSPEDVRAAVRRRSARRDWAIAFGSIAFSIALVLAAVLLAAYKWLS